MENNILEIESASGLVEMVINKHDNNLDGLDNLSEIPEKAAVYALCGRVNGQAANCRFVGASTNLQTSIRNHFSNNEPDTCLKTFMQSIKIKVLVYSLIDIKDNVSVENYVREWNIKFKPDCNETLNKVH